MSTIVQTSAHARARTRLARVAGVPLLVTALVATGAALATPAGAQTAAPGRPAVTARPASVSQYDLVVDPLKVTSSTHKALTLFVAATASFGFATSANATVDLSGPKDVETHSWIIPVPTSTLSVGSGSGSFATGSDLGSFGHVTLTFAKSSAPTNRCIADEKTTDEKVRVHGTVSFASQSTGSHAWGTVTTTVNVAGSLTTFTTSPCTEALNDCALGVSWAVIEDPASTAPGSTAYFGDGGSPGLALGPNGTLVLSKIVKLAAPVGAEREDLVQGKEPIPVLHANGSTASMSVGTSAGGPFHGSATLHSVKFLGTRTAKCSATKSQATADWTASYTNGATPLSAPEQVFGTIKIANLAHPGKSILDEASIERVTA